MVRLNLILQCAGLNKIKRLAVAIFRYQKSDNFGFQREHPLGQRQATAYRPHPGANGKLEVRRRTETSRLVLPSVILLVAPH